jgi:hypothetical protein
VVEKYFAATCIIPQRHLHAWMTSTEDCEGRSILVRPLRVLVEVNEAAPPVANGKGVEALPAPRKGAVPTARAAILKLLETQDTVSLKGVAELTGLDRKVISNAMYFLAKTNVVKRIGSATYALRGKATKGGIAPAYSTAKKIDGRSTRPTPSMDAALAIMRAHPGQITTEELTIKLREAGQQTPKRVDGTIRRLKKRGLIRVVAFGVYELTAKGVA